MFQKKKDSTLFGKTSLEWFNSAPLSSLSHTKSASDVRDFLVQGLGNLINNDSLDAPPPPNRDPDGIFDREDGWETWAKLISGFKSLADWHREVWSWAWKIQPGISQDPIIAIAPRGAGKSSCAEHIAVALGALAKRKFILYLRASQEQANASVANIASILESPAIERFFPAMSERSLSKFGQSKGWNRQILRTASGFSVLGHGLDTALRGVRLENIRPDFIIFDDVDELSDSVLVTQRKIAHITKSILPAGSTDVIVMGVQNLLLADGVFARLAKARPEFLARRTLVGPIQAVEGLEYTIEDDGRPYIVAGTPTWPEGQNLEVCAQQMADWGVSSFLNEAQHDLTGSADGMFAGVDFDQIELSESDLPDLTYVAVAIDPAVTSGRRSHAQAFQIDGIGTELDSGRELIYRLYSWEGVESPEKMLRLAITKACEFGAKEVAIETNQGGELWEMSFMATAQELLGEGIIDYIPSFTDVKANASLGDKESRAQSMLNDYERRVFRHVEGNTNQLKKSLRRFPKIMPDDLADAAYWSWSLCRKKMKNKSSQKAGVIPRRALLGRGDERRAAIMGMKRGGRVRLGSRSRTAL